MVDAPLLLNDEIEIGGKKFGRKANETVLNVVDEHSRFRDATAKDRNREFENLRFFAGVDDGQFPENLDIDKMRDEGRHIGTYNLSLRKVAGINGSITRNPFDVKYMGDDPKSDKLTEALQQAYLSDKELMDWDSEFNQCITHGLIYQGIMELKIETEAPASPLGNIALRTHLPGSCIPDPDWKAVSSKKLRTLYREAYMTADRMKAVFDAKNDEITREIALLELTGKTFDGNNQRVDWNRDLKNRRGSQFLVIEKHYLESEKVTREFDPATGTIFWEWMKDEEKVELAQRLDIDPSRIREKEVMVNVYKRQVVSPDIPNLVLFEGKDIRQFGRLPFYLWSATRINGKNIGIIDFVKDAQREVNFRQGTISLGAQGAVTAGALVDPAMFGNDQDKIKDFKENYGDPRQIAELKSGASRQFPDGLKPMSRVQIPGELFNIVGNMIDLMDLLAPQPAAGEARSERSGESGIHFAQKLEVMKTLQTPMMTGVRQMMNDIGESYLFLAAQLYSKGRRKFGTAKDKKEIIVNDPAIDVATGVEVIDNDFSQLMYTRHRINITEAPSGINIRLMQRELNMGYMQNWPQNLPNSQLTFAEHVLNSQEMTEDEKANALEGFELDKRLVRSQTEAQIAQNEAVVQQIEQQKQQQQQAQAAPPPPGGGEGAPVEPGAMDIPASAAPPELAVNNPPTQQQEVREARI